MRKTLAVFVKNLTSGGAEKQSVLLAKTMADEYDVHYIIFNGKHIHQKYWDLLTKDARIHIVAFNGGFFSRFYHFFRYVKFNSIDVIFSYLTAANVFACFVGLMTKAKIVTGLRNAELPWAKHFVDRFLTNNMSVMTVCNCYSGKDHFCNHGFSEKKVNVIPNCFEHISPFSKKGVKDVIKVITVGRFVAQKDYNTAIRSIRTVAELCPNLRFVIVGYGELEEQIRLWLKQYDIERITEIYINPDNISQLLDNSDIYLSTSLFEGTSNSIMEGMNANLPVVATNVGDNYALVHHEKNGFLHATRDVKGLAASIQLLCQDVNLRNEMGKEGKHILQECFSEEMFKNRYNHLINNIIN